MPIGLPLAINEMDVCRLSIVDSCVRFGCVSTVKSNPNKQQLDFKTFSSRPYLIE